jgi:hypothetical protein
MLTPLPGRVLAGRRGKIVAFPLAAQRPLVTKLAARMAATTPARADKILNAEIQRRVDALYRQGLRASAVEREMRAFESAIRTEL